MRYRVQVVALKADGTPGDAREIAVIERPEVPSAEEFGLSLADAKTILRDIQKILVREQAAQLGSAVACAKCKAPLGVKDQREIVYRTLFGTVRLPSPRYHVCACFRDEQHTLSLIADLLKDRFSPEYRKVMADLASRVSYGAAATRCSKPSKSSRGGNASTSRTRSASSPTPSSTFVPASS